MRLFFFALEGTGAYAFGLAFLRPIPLYFTSAATIHSGSGSRAAHKLGTNRENSEMTENFDEIERKFLVNGPVPLPKTFIKIGQGYLPESTPLQIKAGFLVITPLPNSPGSPQVGLPLTAREVKALQEHVLHSSSRKVLRIRVEDGISGVFSLKVDQADASHRKEVELSVPILDAMYLLQACGAQVLRKVRFAVPHGGRRWDVDVFQDPFNGLLTAELETARVGENVDLPSWVGAEVTQRPEFSNRALAEAQKMPAFVREQQKHLNLA